MILVSDLSKRLVPSTRACFRDGCLISTRSSGGIGGRPDRDFSRQSKRHPARCQRINVSGRTTTKASRQLQNRESNAREFRVTASIRRGFTRQATNPHRPKGQSGLLLLDAVSLLNSDGIKVRGCSCIGLLRSWRGSSERRRRCGSLHRHSTIAAAGRG